MSPDAVPDWSAVTAETTEQLRRLIRYATVNPPGDEAAIAAYLAGQLHGAGIAAEIIPTLPSRAAVVGRIPGDGSRAPVLLLAHTDVVGADAAHWSVDPFEGDVRDGYVYGRGAIDDKGMLAANLVTMLLLQRAVARGALTLARDVIFLATPDEESGGEAGMRWLMRHRPDVLRAEYALNEGGRVRVGADGTRTLLIQTAEKSSHIVSLTARGTSGHAGVPRADNAILRLGRALAAISAYASDPAHGVSPTILEGGDRSNVIPDQARVIVNVRTTPSQSLDAVVAELARLVADSDVAVQIVERGEVAPASSETSPMYAALADAARELDPAIRVQPYLSAGVTDSARLRQLGVAAYGVLPFPLTMDDESRMHGVDERVPVSALGFGTRLIFECIVRIARAGKRSH